MVHALHSRRVITPQGERDAAVIIDGEHITAIHPLSELSATIPVEDLGNLALLPGLIDVHTHINEPGRTEWEGFATATRAAAAGGFTTVIDMPLNCLPETTDVTALELKREAAAGKCMVDYALWGGAVDGNQHNLEPLALAGVPGFKAFLIYPGCDGFTAIDRANLELAIPHIARTGLPLLVHAELDTTINAAFDHLNATGADWRKYSTYLASRPDEAELEAIELLLNLCRAHRFRLHIVHLSTAQALPLLAAAKHEGLPVTVETCPHFLHITAEQIPDGATLFKCTPPIRSAANRELLWQALLDGTIDLIATDHSPCPPHMKRLTAEPLPRPADKSNRLASDQPASGHPASGRPASGRFDEAWGGIPSLSTALSVLWTECTRRELTLAQLSQWTSAAPARLAGLSSHVGSIEPGKHANLIAFDPEALFTLTEEKLHYRHKISPYLGETLRGSVRTTWLRGQRIFDDNTFPTTPHGREYALSYPNN
jgi:allantoinase